MAAARAQLLLLLCWTAAVLLSSANCQCASNCDCPLEGICCLVVQENQPPTEIGRDLSQNTLNRTAPFTNPTYNLESSDLKNLGDVFQVNPTTGAISTLRRLDRENETFITNTAGDSCIDGALNIIVADPGAGFDQINYVVNIKVSDVNDNSPVFSEPQYEVTIPETVLQDGSPTTVECRPQDVNRLTATDADDSAPDTIEYQLRGNASSLFVISDPMIPCIQNAQGIDLDRDTPPSSYTFTLVAVDTADTTLSSSTQVTYVLEDVNDNDPTFENSSYVISVREDQPVLSEIFQFQATDIDAGSNGGTDLLYSIDPNDFFTVNQTTGHLILTRGLDADPQTADTTYDLTVTATDRGMTPRSGTASVRINIIDVNERATVTFVESNNHVTEITENQITQGIAFFEIEDRDGEESNRDNTLAVVGDSAEYFRAVQLPNMPDRFTQIFVITQTGAVDFEQNRTVYIELQTTEGGDTVLSQTFFYNLTVLDENDNKPSLSTTRFNFTEDVEGGSGNRQIVDLSEVVFDPDDAANGMVGEYVLISVKEGEGDMVDLTQEFSGVLDQTTGILSTRGLDISLDREVLGNTLEFQVNLTDMGDPPLSQVVNFTVTLQDINDNSPVFDQPHYTFSVLENQDISTSIGRVGATDPDYIENGTLIYSIEDEAQFNINHLTGDLSTAARFNREVRETYNITVRARDNGTPPRQAQPITVTITILDENDNDPKFTTEIRFTIDTSFRLGDEVGTVTATDEDKAPNNIVIYQLESPSSIFTIPNSSVGLITLLRALNVEDEGPHQLNISAFNPGRESEKDVITIFITVEMADPFTIVVIGGIAGGAAALLIVLIIIVILLILCFVHKNRKYKNRYDMKEEPQKTILKIPATNGQQPRSRVTFNESVQETHYNEQSVVTDTNNTIRKESITKFDNYPREHRPFTNGIDEREEEDEGVEVEDGATPLSADHLHQAAPPPSKHMDVVELEMSPAGHMVNGDLPLQSHHRNYNMRAPGRPHSPIVRVVGGGEAEFSQGTSSDGHTYMDDEESMFSDDASIMNTNISRYGGAERHRDLDAQYGTPSTHSHLDLHHHLPPMSHGQPTNSSLAKLHAHNLAQLAEANRHQHYAGSLLNGSSEPSHSLTLTPRDHMEHTTISTTQSTHSHSPPSPRHSHNHLGPVAAERGSTSSNHLHSSAVGVGGGRKYPHPLVMPDAFPRDTTDIHRFPIGSYAEDYGETSTYASAELDEALGFNLDAEPGIISLTATTDYEDTML